jgi:L-ribulose-5-phosphate 4-epimerase
MELKNELEGLKDNIVKGAERLVSSNALSLSKHGNMSMRLPHDKDRILITGSPSLAIRNDDIALIDLDGNLIEGRLRPTSNEVVGMHTVVYKSRDDVNCVIHTHSPYATAFAVASMKIDPVY